MIVVDAQDGLKEQDVVYRPTNKLLRGTAYVISVFFHPLFIPVYIAWTVMMLQPYLLSTFTPVEKAMTLLRFFVIYCFFPLVTILLLKGLGFIKSIHLSTQRERVIPYVACGIYYFWMWYVLHNQAQFAQEIVNLSMAIFLASSIGLIVNNFMKVSMHAISMGILVGFALLLAFTQEENFLNYLIVTVLVAGVVCTARLILSTHTPKQIYAGLAVGLVSQVLALLMGAILP